MHHRFLADELTNAGRSAGERRVWRGVLAAADLVHHGPQRTPRRREDPGPAVPDDHLQRDFTATGFDPVWVTDIAEHPMGQGRVYCCTIRGRSPSEIVCHGS